MDMPIAKETDYSCESCGLTSTSEDDFANLEDSLACEDCQAQCFNCGELMWKSNSRYVQSVGNYCENCWALHTERCERCENAFPECYYLTYITDHAAYFCEDCCRSVAIRCDVHETYNVVNCEDCERGSVIHDYSYKPDPCFYGQDSNDLFFGLELEMEIRSGNVIESAEYIQDKVDGIIYLKDDSSIGEGGYAGFELVSHPLSFGHWNTKMGALWEGLDFLRENEEARSWDAVNCGIHVHVSRAGFKSDAHTHRWLTLIYKNANEMMKLAGRKSDYAKFDDVRRYDQFDRPYFDFRHKLDRRERSHSERDSAVNTQNEDTLELRIFKGTTKPSGVLSAIELAHASIEYTRNLTISDVKFGMLEWDWFYDYVEANNGFYPNLYQRMAEVPRISLSNIEKINA